MASDLELDPSSLRSPTTPSGVAAACTQDLGDTRLLDWMRDALGIVDRCLDERERERGAAPEHVALAGERRTRLLELLAQCLASEDACLSPTPDPRAPRAHACPRVEEPLGLPPGAGLEVLEHLADLGLLRRDLHNLVHLCPACTSWKLNFREVCPSCRGIDVRVEPMLQHFRCAYVGLDSEFRRGLELVCPRCNAGLQQLGHDFERPHHSWVCNVCDDLFEEPLVEVQCLDCEALHISEDLAPAPVYRYRPTTLAARAVETGRLTGLELEDLLCDHRAGLDSREFLRMEVAREVARLSRHGGVFSVAVLEFRDGPEIRPVLERGWPEIQRALGRVLGGLRSPLDLVARLDAGRVGLLLPATDEAAARAIGERLLEELVGRDLAVDEARRRFDVRPHWSQSTWCERGCDLAHVLEFLGLARDGS